MAQVATVEPQNGNPTLKRRLGRGLNALLGSAEADAEAADAGANGAEADAVEAAAADANLPTAEVAVELIERNPWQPRQQFAEDGLIELTDSVKQHGVLQPLLIRKSGETYQLIAGERRLLAARRAGLTTVPCRLMELEDQQVCEVAIEENLKRRDLNDLEKAVAFQEYLKQFDSSIEDLAKKLSKSRSYVSNTLRLLDLPDSLKDALSGDRISAGHARALLPLTQEQQEALTLAIETENWSVRRTEEAVRDIQSGKAEAPSTGSAATATTKPAAKPKASNHVASLQDQLRQLLGMKVEIRLKSKSAGRVMIHFGSNDDFEKLFKTLRQAAAMPG